MDSRHVHLSIEEKNHVAQFLLQHNKNMVPERGKIKEASTLFGICRRTVLSIWTAAKKQKQEGMPILLKSSRIGLKHKRRCYLDEAVMMNIPIKERSTQRDLAVGLNTSKSTVGRWIKEGQIKSHTNALKPILTESNKLQRLHYSLSQLHVDKDENKVMFKCMRNIIHIDEKWFFMTKEGHICYKLPSEAEPYRTCKSKRYITKVMFLCAVGRTQYASDGTLLFDGKVGIFPFTELVPAARNSKNRQKGTMEVKNIKSITKNVIRNCIITQVIPSLKSKWPINASKDIFIQQDNVRPHIANNDPEFREVASSDGFNIQLICQPPNSPDTNINDLGWFRSIQSLQHKKKANNVEGLVKNVVDSFEELTPITLNKVFLSLQGCCIEIMKCKGHNNYSVPHKDKDRLIREGNLPDNLEVDDVLVRECIEHLGLPGTGVETTHALFTLVSDLRY